jgi:hypothetical protein
LKQWSIIGRYLLVGGIFWAYNLFGLRISRHPNIGSTLFVLVDLNLIDIHKKALEKFQGFQTIL